MWQACFADCRPIQCGTRLRPASSRITISIASNELVSQIEEIRNDWLRRMKACTNAGENYFVRINDRLIYVVKYDPLLRQLN